MIIYHNDHLGTPQKLTAVNGAVVWSAKYSSFGKATIDPTSTITNNLRFPGQYYDAETGLHYNYNRYYNPTTARYLKVDPIGLLPNKKSIPKFIRLEIIRNYNHIYCYAKNNPANFIDPQGLFPCPEGQHLEKDAAGFYNCMVQNPKILAACSLCAASAVTGVGTAVGIPACLACLSFELNCAEKNSKCVCD